MRLYSLFIAVCTVLGISAQTVTTYAGIENTDPTVNYESRTSSVDLDSTYFAYPNNMCFDPSGKMFVSENNKIRMLTGGYAYIRAGKPTGPTLSEGYVNNTGTQATFRVPSGMVCDADGNIYVADAGNHCIRKINKFVNVSNGQIVTTFAGANPPGTIPGYGTPGSANGTGSAARFNQPQGICVDGNGNFYVADYNNYVIRKITPSGVVTTLAGQAGSDGTTDASTGANSRFGGPWGIAMLDANHLVVSDPWNTNIRKVNISTGATETIAGPTTGASLGHVDGTLSDARFKRPKGMVVIDGIIYLADQNIIRAIDISNNQVTTFAGQKTVAEVIDGTGTDAAFTEIEDLATDGSGVFYATENSGFVGSHVIRKISIDNLAPNADFIASPKNLIVNQNTWIKDISTGATVNSRTWTITPTNYSIKQGDLSSDSLQVSFSATGFYKVKLSITNDYGTDVEEKDAYINVSTTNSVSNYYTAGLLKLYPNPSNNLINLELVSSLNRSRAVVSIYSTDGRLLKQTEYSNTIDVSDLNNGAYFLTLDCDDIHTAQRFMIAR